MGKGGNWASRKGFQTAGLELRALLVAKGITQVEVARRLRGKGWGIRDHMFYQLTAGTVGCTPAKWNMVLDASEVTMEERFRLNQCAARDCGWVIGQMPSAHMVRRRANVWNRVPRAQWKIRAPKYDVKKVTVDIVPVVYYTEGDSNNGAAARDLGSDRDALLCQCGGETAAASALDDGARLDGVAQGSDPHEPERPAAGDGGGPERVA